MCVLILNYKSEILRHYIYFRPQNQQTEWCDNTVLGFYNRVVYLIGMF